MRHHAAPLQPHDILRLETCLATVAHLDPGPIDGVSDAALEHTVQTYADTFAKTDIMAMGRDPESQEVWYAAFRALLYHCWRQDQLPPSDPLRRHPPPPPAW